MIGEPSAADAAPEAAVRAVERPSVAMAARVAWITIAPIKSLGLVQRDEVRLEPFGVAADRRFVLVDRSGNLVNGKRAPALSTVLPDLDEEAGVLVLHFPDRSTIASQVELDPWPVVVRIFGREVPGNELRGPWASALSDFVGLDLRMIRLDVPGAGVDRPEGNATILSVASLERLASAADLAARPDERRFRMLFGIDGVAAHAEDRWIDRRVRIGEALVVPGGNVGRCVVTTRHPDTALPDLDTLRILAEYRTDETTTEALPFGVWASVTEPGLVRVGDPVLLERG